ncbi:MAG: hypothetical protein WBB17_00975 [Saprospiraceae bacterium]|jgi:hypothetical protein|nr:hypothetical protein [Saprospiraceae bacterium]
MVDTFTSNQFVRFIYKECSTTEAAFIEESCDDDWEMHEEITMLKEAKFSLPMALFAAHPTSLVNILNYSRKTA